jgi:formylglycine-generating enzyme required for sulfatase activity
MLRLVIRSSGLLLLSLSGLACGISPAGNIQQQNYSETIRGTDVQIEMVWIAEGQFWIGKTEITWDQFLPYCDFEETGAVPPDADAVSKPSKPLDWAPYDRDWGAGSRPAVGMSWNAARKYCQWLSLNSGHDYRLPSEAEWELACGDAVADAAHAWTLTNSGAKTQEVGRKSANAQGLHDMLGNLWEYCRDPYNAQDPERAVLRGGSWREAPAMLSKYSRLGFDQDWILDDPNYPPGVWWVPGGSHLGLRILRPGPDSEVTPQDL